MASPEKLAETHLSTPTSPQDISPNLLTSSKNSPLKKLTDLPEELLEKIFKHHLPSILPHKYRNLGIHNVESYVALSLTSKQFRRIVLPHNTLDRRDWIKSMLYMQYAAQGIHWSCSRSERLCFNDVEGSDWESGSDRE
jgi:hypothetical protein